MGGGCTPCLFRPSQTQFLTPQTSVRDTRISELNYIQLQRKLVKNVLTWMTGHHNNINAKHVNPL